MEMSINVERGDLPAIVYRSSPLLCYGDYGGAGTVGHANIATILADARVADHYLDGVRSHPEADELKRHNAARYPRAFLCHYSHGSAELYVRADVWRALELDSLDDYVVIDDEELHEVEHAWETEYLDDEWNARDFFRDVEADVGDYAEALEALGLEVDEGDDVSDVFRNAEDPAELFRRFLVDMMDQEVYPEFEHGYCPGDTCITNTKKLQGEFLEWLKAVPFKARQRAAKAAGQQEIF